MDIAIYEAVSRSRLVALLRRVEARARDAFQVDVEVLEQVDNLPDPPETPPQLLLWIEDGDGEPFKVLLGIGFDPEHTPDGQDGVSRLAGWLSVELQCRTVCDGSDHVDDDAPFWCVLWDRGRAFLADDAELDPGDGEPPGELRIVRPLPELRPDTDPTSIARAFRQV